MEDDIKRGDGKVKEVDREDVKTTSKEVLCRDQLRTWLSRRI